MKWFIKVMKNYVNFTGRATRTEYWMSYLFYVIFAFCVGLIDGIFGLAIGTEDDSFGIIGLIFVLGTILPYLAVMVRRLHDIGKSGWWILISLVPLVGNLVLFIFTLLPSVGDNQYGPIVNAKDEVR